MEITKRIKAKIIGYEHYSNIYWDYMQKHYGEVNPHVGVLLDCKPEDIKPGDIITNLDRFPQILGDYPNG